MTEPEPFTEEWLLAGLESTPRYQNAADRLEMLAQPGTPLYDKDDNLIGMRYSPKIEGN